MKPEYLAVLKRQMLEELCAREKGVRVAIVGHSAVVSELETDLKKLAPHCVYLGFFDLSGYPQNSFNAQALGDKTPDFVVVADDEHREALVEAVNSTVQPRVRILVGGFGHFADPAVTARSINDRRRRPTFANGYPNSLIGTFQSLKCRENTEREGVTVEFGVFEGGTTMLISRFIRALGVEWKIFGFDTFDRLQNRRRSLDTYNHPDCVNLDRTFVQRVFEGRHVGAVATDVAKTIVHLKSEQLTPPLVGSSNFVASRTVLNLIADRVQAGGEIVLDHWSVRNRFLYTLGDRIAAKQLVVGSNYMNLHDSGVFLSMP